MDSTPDVVKRTREWVETQGYPLEMKVAKAFREAGFEVRQSELYKDEGTAKYREIDLLVYYPDHIGVIRISLTVECKSSNKPWVLFDGGNGAAGMSIYWTYSLMSQAARTALCDAAPFGDDDPDRSIYAQFDKLLWLKKTSVSYALREAFVQTDNAYAALNSSMKAASHTMHLKRKSKFPQIRFVFPLVVVDAPLLVCKLSPSLEPEMHEVSSGEVFFTHPERYADSTCVRIVTLAHLANFITEAKTEFANLTREVLPAANRIWQQEFGRPLNRL